MDRSDRLASILADWRERRERGESIAPDDVVRRHPEIAKELRARFAAIEMVDARFGTAALIPKKIGEFRIVRELGRGGMGIVYEAEQPSMRRRVALKVLFPSIVASPNAVERFQREAWAAGRLKHTNIVAVHQLGQDGPIWYSAMELVDGRPLNEVIDELRTARKSVDGTRGPGKESETFTGETTGAGGYYTRVAQMFAGVADALEVAHEQGVIHRDIKPSNLLLDTEGNLKVVDFGLARLEDAAAMTMTGDVVGTPHYMSPEQLVGKRSAIGPHTDVYALGATLYEALALRPPFRAPSFAALTTSILKKEPRSPRRIDRSIPLDLETIILKALDKQPERRFASAGEMARELRRFAEGAAIKARPIGPVDRAWRMVKRHKVRSGLATAVVLSLLIGGWAMLVAKREAEHRHALQYESLCRQADLASTAEWNVHEALVPEMDQAAHAEHLYTRAIVHAPERWTAYLGRALVRSPRPVDDRFADVAAARARGLSKRTAHLARAFLFSEGMDVPLSLVDAERESALAAALPEEDALDAYLEGRVLLARGMYERAEATFTRALSRARGQGSQRFLALMRRGIAREFLEDWEGAFQDWLAAQQLLGDDSLETRMRIAALWWRLGRTEHAAEVLATLIDEARTRGTEHAWYGMLVGGRVSGEAAWSDRLSADALAVHPNSVLLLHCRFDVQFEAGDVAGALRTTEGASEAQRRDFRTVNREGRALAALGRHEEALTAYRAALQTAGDNPLLLVNIAVALFNVERMDESLASVEAALLAAPGFVPALAHKSRVLADLGRNAEALEVADQAVSLAPELPWASASRASALRRVEKLDEALAEVERTVLLDPRHGDAWWIKARILRDLGRPEEALAAYDRALVVHPGNDTAMNGRAMLLSNYLNRPREAAEAWEQLIRLGKARSEANAQLWLGSAYQGMGRYQDAIVAYQAVLAAPPDRRIVPGEIHSNCARCLEGLGRIDDAMRAHKKALELAPQSAGVHVNVAGTLISQGAFAEALKYAKRSLELDSAMHAGHYAAAQALSGLGEHQSALDQVEHFLAAVPNDADGHHVRGRELKSVGRPEEALIEAERVIELSPKVIDGFALMGDLYLMDLEDEEKALEAYEAALRVDPEHFLIRVNRALILTVVGRAGEGITALEAIIDEQAHPYPIFLLARILATCEEKAVRDPARAVKLARRAAALLPQQPDVQNTLGVALCSIEDWKGALRALELAVSLRPEASGLDEIYLAIVHARLGDKVKAREQYTRAKTWIAEHATTDDEVQSAKAEAERLLGE